jgi:phage baseplate assembly protein V
MSETSVLGRRVMNMVSRGIISETDDESGMQTVQVSLLYQEGKAKVERMQNYGFSGHAPGQSEVTVVFIGGGRDHGVIIATDDRDSRFTGLAEGEVAIYTDEGDSIVLKRDNTIELTTKTLTIKAEEAVTIETKQATVTASEKITLDAPDILLKGNVEIDGTLSQAAGGGASTYTIRGDVNQIGNINVDGNITATDSINAPNGSVGNSTRET